MKKILLFICIPFIGFAQDYQLDFNSANLDYVEMQNASSVIANKTAFSMSCWVYPEANTDHAGIIGFRNNTDADFYLLQLQNTNNIEARFRNSLGVNYDIIATNALDFNQWQHLTFTYDGTFIRLYKNGIIVDSTAANGTITETTQSFNLGMLDYQGSAFHLNGRLDEIRLWDVALSTTEIIGWICSPIYLFHPNYNNLMGYWRLNDGQGTIADDQSSNGNNGTLMGGIQWQNSTSCFGSTSQSLTYVPDDNFENYLESNGMGDGIALNDSVFTASINTVTYLDVNNLSISDLTGIGDFSALTILLCPDNQITSLDVSNHTALTQLYCNNNQITSLDVSANIALTEFMCSTNLLTSLDVSTNTALIHLICSSNQLTILDLSANTALTALRCVFNQLTSLDVSGATALTELHCHDNQLTSLDVSNNTALTILSCSINQLTSLDVSTNTALTFLGCEHNSLPILNVSGATALTELYCYNNQLTSLDVRNGNNTNFINFNSTSNPNLFCIDVDNPTYSTTNWTNIDAWASFSSNCSVSAIDDMTEIKKLLKIIDVLGRDTKGANYKPLFYIYDDGTVKKKMIIE